MAKPRKGGLGKGLEALFVDNTTEDITPLKLKITEIEPNQNQPRKDFDDGALGELADSIREHGILQPLVVRPLANGRYQIVAGERRWRASRMVGLTEVPVVVKELTETEGMELALIENLQREDLTALEEAWGYETLMKTYGLSQDMAAKRVGKSRSAVANALRLLSLPQYVSELLKTGKISAGHARALLGAQEEELMEILARKVVEGELSVRQTEKLVAQAKKAKTESVEEAPKSDWGDSYYREIAMALTDEMGQNVKVKAKKDRGSVEIQFANRQELDQIVAMLMTLNSGR